ncbi:MAG: hypothetical protein Q8Q67_00725 [bacterium]|nr:hypothetical protein [bacterium]
METKTNTGPRYETLTTMFNVKVTCPPPTDEFFTIMDAHTFIDADGKTINVPKHIRRGDRYKKIIVTKNYYIDYTYAGETFTADKVVVLTSKNETTGAVRMVIDIYKTGDKKVRPESELKTFSPTGEPEMLIPGTTDMFIRFKPIQVRVTK